MPGAGDVLDLIRSGRVTTRGEVLDATGLSRMTVAGRVDALLAAGLVVERSVDRATGGRRPRGLVFNDDHARLLVVTVDTRHSAVAVTDLAGRSLRRRRVEVAVADGPGRTLPAIVEAGRLLLAEEEAGAPGLGGVAVSVPGPVDPSTGRPSQPPIMPGWDDHPVEEELRAAFGVPVLVANDADAAALGEQRAQHPGSPSLVMVKVSTGIGTGLVLGGRVFQGVDGGAGDIGHVRLPQHLDALCQCGSHGCLAAVASGGAVARSLRQRGRAASSGSDVGALLAAGDPDAAHLVREAGRTIGEVLATVVCLVNPAHLVVGGDLASPPLLAGVREALYPRCLPRATRHLEVLQSGLGDEAAVIGLAALLVDREYAPAVVNGRLG